MSHDVFLVALEAAPYSSLGLRVVLDPTPGHGPLSGLEGALRQARNDRVFVAACDMPFLSTKLIEEMVRQLEGHDAVMPESDSGVEPLHAVYSRSALPAVAAALASGELRLRALTRTLRVRLVPSAAVRALAGDLDPFVNVNRPEDLRRLSGKPDRA